MSDKYTYKTYGVTLSNISEGLYSIEEIEKLLVDMKATKKQTEERLNMIKRVSELMLGGYESVMYYCTLCNRPFKPLQEANEHAKFCGKAVPVQPTAALPDDDDTQVYKKPWVGLTDEEIESAISDGFARGLDDGNVPNKIVINYVRVIEAALRSKNT